MRRHANDGDGRADRRDPDGRHAPTIGTVAARATTAAAFLALAVVALAQHRRRAGLVRLDAQRHETDDVLVEAELALEFDDRRRRRVDVQKREIRLAVLLDAEGEGFETPCLDLRHRAALRGDQRLELFGESFDLRRSHVLTRHIDMLVESHDRAFLFPFASHAEPFEPAERLDSDPSKAGTREDGSALPSDDARAPSGLPFSPQRDTSKRRVIGARAPAQANSRGRLFGAAKLITRSAGKS